MISGRKMGLGLICLFLSLGVFSNEECEFSRNNYTKDRLKFYDLLKNIYENGGTQQVANCGSVVVESMQLKSGEQNGCAVVFSVVIDINGEKFYPDYIIDSNSAVPIREAADWFLVGSQVNMAGRTIYYNIDDWDEILPAYERTKFKFKFNKSGQFSYLKYKSYRKILLIPGRFDREKGVCR